MITVPTLGDDRVTLNPTNTQRVQTQAPDFGEDSQRKLNASVSELTNTALKVEQAEIEKANQIIGMESDTKLGELETDLLYNVDSGAFNKKGKDSFGTPDTVTMDWDFGVKEIEAGLASDSQRAAFRKRAGQRKAGIDKSLMRHISKESMEYDNQVTESYIANEKNAALENFADPERVDESIELQKQAIINHSDRNGMPAEYKRQKIEELQSGTYTGVITRILDGGADVEAGEYYQKNKHLMTAKDQILIEKQLEAGTFLGEAQRATDDIFSKTDDHGKALENARKITDAKKRAEVVRQVKGRISENRMLDAEAKKDNFNEAFEIVSNTQSMKLPPRIYSQLTPSQKMTLEGRIKQLKSGRNVDDFKTYYNLELMAAHPKTRKKFMDSNINEYANKLSKAGLKKFSKMQADIIKGDSSTTKMLDGLQSKASIINDTLKVMKIGKDDTERSSQFRKTVDDEVIRRQENSGKKVNNDELRKIVGSLAREYIVGTKYFFMDDTKRSFEIDTSQIPEDTYNELKKSLESKGHKATEEKILDLYKFGLENK